MLANVVTRTDGPSAMQWTEVDEPDGEVVVAVEAAGVSHPDLLMTYGRYQAAAAPPFVPGAEVAGTVLRAAAGSSVAVGDRVVALTGLGGYAERVAVPAASVWKAPEGLTWSELAALPVNVFTAVFAAAERGRLVAGETVLVLGAAGGLGLANVQVAQALGAEVVAVVRRSGHEDVIRSAGADHVVPLASMTDDVRAITQGRGVDVVLDPVGGEVFDDALRLLAPGGRIVVLGFAGGSIPQVKVNRLLLRNVDVVGAGLAEHARADPSVMVRVGATVQDLVAAGLRPVIGLEAPLSEAADVLARLEAGEVVGKAVLLA